MLNKIIDFALKNRLAIVVAALIILCAGLYNVQEMDVDVFPDLNAPTVVVMTRNNSEYRSFRVSNPLRFHT